MTVRHLVALYLLRDTAQRLGMTGTHRGLCLLIEELRGL